MNDNEWLRLSICCTNVARQVMRKSGIYNQDMINDLAEDMLAKCSEYILLKDTKPRDSLVNFVFMYGLKPVLYTDQRKFEDRILNLEGLTDDMTLEDLLEGSEYEDGKIKLRNAIGV